jgi:hypothetical protein
MALSRPVLWTARSWSVWQLQNALRYQPFAPDHTPGPTGTRVSEGVHIGQGKPEHTRQITLSGLPLFKGLRGVSCKLDAFMLFFARLFLGSL